MSYTAPAMFASGLAGRSLCGGSQGSEMRREQDTHDLPAEGQLLLVNTPRKRQPTSPYPQDKHLHPPPDAKIRDRSRDPREQDVQAHTTLDLGCLSLRVMPPTLNFNEEFSQKRPVSCTKSARGGFPKQTSNRLCLTDVLSLRGMPTLFPVCLLRDQW